MNTKYKAGRLLFFAGVFTAFLFSFLSSFIHSEETEEAVAMLTEMSGSVLVKDAQDGSFKKAEINQPLYAGDEIRTKKGASCEIEFKTESIVRLDENTDFKIHEVKETSKGNKTSVQLFTGKILNVVSKTANSSFEVKTPTSIAGVRGTEFAVEATEENTDIGVFSGRVGVTGMAESGTVTEEIDLTEDMETSVQKFKKPGAPRKLKEKMRKWKQYLAKHRPRLYQKLKESPELRQKLKKHLRKKFMTGNKKEKLKEKLKDTGNPEEKKMKLKNFIEMKKQHHPKKTR